MALHTPDCDQITPIHPQIFNRPAPSNLPAQDENTLLSMVCRSITSIRPFMTIIFCFLLKKMF
jgi:hypothetical protein